MVQAAALRQAATIMASLNVALAPHGLIPLPDDPQRAAQDAAQVSETLGEAGYTVEAHCQHKNVPGSSDHQPWFTVSVWLARLVPPDYR